MTCPRGDALVVHEYLLDRWKNLSGGFIENERGGV